jgi:hypothetical protein
MNREIAGLGYDWRYRKSFSLEDLRVMDESERLRKSSRRLRKVFVVLMVLAPILNVVFWVGIGMGNDVLGHTLPVQVDPDIPASSLVFACLIGMIPTSVFVYALYQLIKLFGYYSTGVIFSKANVLAIRNLGKSIIYWELANFLCSIALGIVLTLHRGTGNRLLVINLQNSDLYALVAGFSVLTIAWVMEEARKIKEEQELIV